jgi:hypothetical protein
MLVMDQALRYESLSLQVQVYLLFSPYNEQLMYFCAHRAISRAAKNTFLKRLSLYGYGTQVATKVAKMFAWDGRLSCKGWVAK